MWSLLFVLFFLLVSAWMVFSKRNRMVVFSARAGGLGPDPTESLVATRINRNVELLDSDGNTYDLSNKKYRALTAAGNSMQERSIEKGNLVIFDQERKLNRISNGEVIAVSLEGEEFTNGAHYKLRIFSHLEEEDGQNRIVVNSYDADNNIQASKFNYPIHSFIGAFVVHLNSKQTQRFLAKYKA